jgi:hypothetical protein
MADFIAHGIEGVKELISFLTSRSKSRDVVKNALLREIRDNLQLLQHRDNNGVHIKGIIENLTTSAIEQAFAENFKFELLSGSINVSEMDIVADRQKRYLGWNAHRLISSIEGKIRELKRLPLIYSGVDDSAINIPSRLDNLYFQLLLLSTLIYRNK